MRQLIYWLFALALFGLTQGPLFGQAPKGDLKVNDDPKIEVKEGPAVVPKAAEGAAQRGPAVVPKGAIPVVSQPGIGCGLQGPCLKYLDAQRLVFVADGAGESTTLTDHLQEAQEDYPNLGLRIQIVNWCRQDHASHDYVDHAAQLQAAARLAGWARLIRKDCPNCQIYFVGFRAGTRVVLAAAEMLPPCSVDRIILIASSVSAFYDLRPALRVSRGGIHNFYSTDDGHLESIVERRGTSDGARGPAAGRVGFRIPLYCGPDPTAVEAYRQLCQVRWTDDLCGNGGHFTWILTHNLKRCVMPLFEQPPMIACRPPVSRPPATAPKIRMKEAKE